MTEKLLTDYLKENEANSYPEFDIENINTAGEWVMFEECSQDSYYRENHMVKLLDVLAWVYSKLGS